ncbi:MAG TPA: hypothetical protein PK347_08595 [Burkholderiaceae bacterium]|nr:hypothetical protein [Burkholderiaceae bacterium]
MKAVNLRSFVHSQHPITLDLFGYEPDASGQCFWGGWWPEGMPREQGRLLRFQPFEIVSQVHPWGRHWTVKDPEALLLQLYGPGWRIPDADFDATLETPALVAFNAYTRAWCALRLLEAWVQGHGQRVKRRLSTLATFDPNDTVVQAFAPK